VTSCDIEAARSGFCSEPFGTAKLNTPPHPETMKKIILRELSPADPTVCPFFGHFGFQVIASQTIEHRSVRFWNFRMEKRI
jgi:hypothetical protein